MSMRRRLDAWFLKRALRVFERRGWIDTPGRTPVVMDAMAQLGYRARALSPSRQIEIIPLEPKAIYRRRWWRL